MEENRFSASVMPEKKYFKEFGRVHMQKSKNTVLFLILGIVFYAAYFGLTAFTGLVDGTYLVVAAYLFFFYWLFLGDFVGQTNYKGMSKKYKGGLMNYYFGETSFSVNSEWENSNVRYAALEGIYESKSIFALYTGKTVAHIIPKSAFKEGSPEEFRQFIEEKTKSKVKKVYTQDKTTLKIVAAVVIFAVMMGGVFLAVTIQKDHEPASLPFIHKEYSISLPGNFEEDSLSNCYFVAQRDNEMVFVVKEDQQAVEEIFGELALPDYAVAVAENLGLSSADVDRLPDGTPFLSYTSEIDGEEYFYYAVFDETGEAYYMTYFVCLNDQWEEHLDKFILWAESIKIKE